MDDETNCAFCKQPLDGKSTVVTLREKGSTSVNQASQHRGDFIRTVPGQRIHQDCRRIYCNPIKIAQANKQDELYQGACTTRSSLRSSEELFNFSTNCLFCGTEVNFEEQRKKCLDIFPVTTMNAKATLLATCQERQDTWADSVQARLLHWHDLPAADAIYHQTCSVNFRTRKQIPKMFSTDQTAYKKQKIGRPQDEERTNAFLKVITYLKDNDDEQTTINDLIEKMDEFLIGSEHSAYGHTYMKTKINEHFADEVIITEINGKGNVVTVRGTAESVLQQFHARQKDDPQMEKYHIIQAAAKLIKDDIKSIDSSNKFYPSTHDMEYGEECLNFLPETLKLLLGGIIVGKNIGVKVASIGQAIMQAARPRVILAPLQVGLAVQLHHHFASRFIIDSLHQHGFCCSYKEVQRFEQNAAADQGTDIPSFTSEFVQYAADNVDHNIRTLDGNDTFHGMGIIAAVTPATKRHHPVPRERISPQDISTTGHIPIQFPKREVQGMEEITYNNLVVQQVHDPIGNIDILWKTSLLFGSTRPSWSGMMQCIHRSDNHPGKSSVVLLPMIDMSSSDVTCIFSTLKFISAHARRHGVTPIITFDQPLWWKALTIIVSESLESDLRRIVLRLGGFHAEMSFLGSIGHLMAGSGLKEMLELIYAPQAVQHIISGKAIARAVRAHLLIDAVLNALIMSNALAIPIPPLQESLQSTDIKEATALEIESTHVTHGSGNAELQEARYIFDQLIKGTMSAEDASEADILNRIQTISQTQMHTMKDDRTAA